MWKRKELKKSARGTLRANYWRCVAVCFLIALLTGAYASSTRIIARQDITEETADSSESHDVVQDLAERYKQEHPHASRRELEIVQWVDDVTGVFVSTSSTKLMVFDLYEDIVNGWTGIVFFLLCITFFLKVFYDIFISNILKIGECRFFMENRIYSSTKINKIIYLYKINAIRRPAWIMFKRDIFQMLWALSIIGGIIKHYEYAMIPYIVAEQPDICCREAFALSKKLMRGNKWKLFLLELSFVGWMLLGYLTLGILQILYVNPYRAGVGAELYMCLRKNEVAPRSYGYKVFTDRYLEEPPSADELLISKLVYDEDRASGIGEAVIEEGRYPGFLYPIQPKYPVFLVSGEANYAYSVLEYIELFFAASVMGWMVEKLIFLLQNGEIVKRGFLTGPWMPIYGLLSIFVVVLMRRYAKKPVLVFALAGLLGSALAYVLSWVIEWYTKIRMWDCSAYFFNLNGRICLEDTVLYGLAGCVFLYYLAPMLEEHRKEGREQIRWIFCGVLALCVGFDVLWSVMR